MEMEAYRMMFDGQNCLKVTLVFCSIIIPQMPVCFLTRDRKVLETDETVKRMELGRVGKR